MMTSIQKGLARHALGLPNMKRRSYRNSFVVALGTVYETQWDHLVSEGLAERGSNRRTSVGYCLTYAGACAAIIPGETLDPEDFPEARAA